MAGWPRATPPRCYARDFLMTDGESASALTRLTDVQRATGRQVMHPPRPVRALPRWQGGGVLLDHRHARRRRAGGRAPADQRSRCAGARRIADRYPPACRAMIGPCADRSSALFSSCLRRCRVDRGRRRLHLPGARPGVRARPEHVPCDPEGRAHRDLRHGAEQHLVAIQRYALRGLRRARRAGRPARRSTRITTTADKPHCAALRAGLLTPVRDARHRRGRGVPHVQPLRDASSVFLR